MNVIKDAIKYSFDCMSEGLPPLQESNVRPTTQTRQLAILRDEHYSLTY